MNNSDLLFNNLCSAIQRYPETLSIRNVIGQSREGRDIDAFKFGTGNVRISLIGGNHADEPVGPLLLRKLVNYLDHCNENDPILKEFSWYIIPHSNSDGEHINNRWWNAQAKAVDPVSYLQHVVRELPGDDMEFGFPHNDNDPGLRVENKIIYDWWRSFDCSFDLHVSLHGMGCAAGPWYLIEQAWQDRIEELKASCLEFVNDKGYRPHDIERNGEKGFFRLGKGFCTRPDSVNMRKFFIEKNDNETAEKFYPSSMEIMRSLSDDCLTLVSEMPLFLLPDVALELGPPDPAALEWKKKIDNWHETVLSNNDKETLENLREEILASGLTPMPILDQMEFQWHFINAGLHQVLLELN